MEVKTIHYKRTIDIKATPDAVWKVLGRFMYIDEFAPLIKSVDALTDGEDRVGSNYDKNDDEKNYKQ